MKSRANLTSFLLVAKRISPRTSIPLVLAIDQGVDRFKSLAEVYPMSSRTLSKAVANMEKEEMIVKNPDGTYSLTSKGKEYASYAKNVAKWAEKHYDIRLF